MKIYIFTIFFIGLFHIASYSQVGIVKSKTGNTIYCNADGLYFTLNTDKSAISNSKWENSNRLTLLENHITLEYFEASVIQEDINSSNNPLLLYQKWETDYIKSNVPNSVKMSEFKTDNIDIVSKDFRINAWYYSTQISKTLKTYSYFIDLYKNGYFIRIDYKMCNDLEVVRSRMKKIVSQLKFYSKPIEIDKL
ncbi:hypothetical protein MCEGE10_01813 [Flavobacteriaceae bacterium]